MKVIWYNGQKGYWDHGLLMTIFDKHPELFDQHEQNIYINRAIVIVAGRPDVMQLRTYLNVLESGVVILTSEEDAFFDWKAAIPDHFKVWTMYYTADRHEIKERLLLGPPSRIKDYKLNTHLPKKYLWSFIGQNQNPFRNQCIEALKQMEGGYLKVTPDFGGQTDGMEYQEYLDIMCQSKYVICPAGSMCVDSFRLYEAMETGAIPITDARSPRDHKDFHFFNEVYPQHKLITVNYWKKEALEVILGMPNNNNWWLQYKKELEQKLINIANG